MPMPLGALGGLKAHMESGNWQALHTVLAAIEPWVFDRPLPAKEAVGALEALLGSTEERRLLVLARLREHRRDDLVQTSYTCCLIWDVAGDWRENEIEFDIHVGAREGTSSWEMVYLGVTDPTPETIPFPDEDRNAGAAKGPPILVPASVAASLATGAGES